VPILRLKIEGFFAGMTNLVLPVVWRGFMGLLVKSELGEER